MLSRVQQWMLMHLKYQTGDRDSMVDAVEKMDSLKKELAKEAGKRLAKRKKTQQLHPFNKSHQKQFKFNGKLKASMEKALDTIEQAPPEPTSHLRKV